MDLLVLLAIGSLALWMVVAIVGLHLLRRRRRRGMGLPPERTKPWRDDPSVAWTDVRYSGSTRTRVPVMVEPGRWTTQRPGETPSQAMNRLTQEGGEPLPPELEHLNHPQPRFRSGGESETP